MTTNEKTFCNELIFVTPTVFVSVIQLYSMGDLLVESFPKLLVEIGFD